MVELGRNPLRLLRRIHAPGTAPGTLPRHEGPPPPTRLRLVRYSPSSLEEKDLLALEGIGEDRPGETCWLAVEGHDPGVIAEIGDRLAVHPLALEDVVNVGQRPKVEEYEDGLFVVLQLPVVETEPLEVVTEQVSIVVQEHRVVSFQERPGPVFDPIRARIVSGRGRMRSGGADYLAYALIDAVVDHAFPILDGIAGHIEKVELALDGDPGPEVLSTLHRLRRTLAIVRRAVWPLRETLARLTRADDELVDEHTLVFYRDVLDHAALIVDMVDTYGEMVNSLVDLYMSAMSNRMNEVMKVLTIIATIFIPLSFIAGLYGMNFATEASPWNMPELHWYWGYPAALGVMAAVALGLLAFFRRKGWI